MTRPVIWTLVVLLIALATWQGLVAAGILSATFFPPPTTILSSLARMTTDGTLWMALAATLGRALSGLALGGLLGLALGLAMGVSGKVRRFADPFVAALHPLPKIALLPLLFVLFGVGEQSKIVMASLGAFFPMLINAMAGVRQMPDIHFEVARSYGAGKRKTLSRVVFPGSLPAVLTGLRLAFNVSLLLTLATELVSAQRGMGALIWFSWQTFRVEDLYACLVALALVGWGFSVVLEKLNGRLVPWAVNGRR